MWLYVISVICGVANWGPHMCMKKGSADIKMRRKYTISRERNVFLILCLGLLWEGSSLSLAVLLFYGSWLLPVLVGHGNHLLLDLALNYLFRVTVNFCAFRAFKLTMLLCACVDWYCCSFAHEKSRFWKSTLCGPHTMDRFIGLVLTIVVKLKWYGRRKPDPNLALEILSLYCMEEEIATKFVDSIMKCVCQLCSQNSLSFSLMYVSKNHISLCWKKLFGCGGTVLLTV